MRQTFLLLGSGSTRMGGCSTPVLDLIGRWTMLPWIIHRCSSNWHLPRPFDWFAIAQNGSSSWHGISIPFKTHRTPLFLLRVCNHDTPSIERLSFGGETNTINHVCPMRMYFLLSKHSPANQMDPLKERVWGWPDLSLSPSAIDRIIIPLALIFRKVAGFGAIYIHPRLEWRELVKGKPGRDLT